MDSLWTISCEIEKRNKLENDLQADVVIIGGGLAGILIAYKLKEKGIESVILEGDRIASGQTKNTTAKITSQHAFIYNTLLEKLGIEKAEQYAVANQTAISEFSRIIKDNNIDCDFEALPSYLYSTQQTHQLEQETAAAQKLGIPASFTTETSLPFSVKGAVRFENQAQFNPLKFIKSVSQDLNIYEKTFVLSVEGKTIKTESCKIKAKHIVFATHYPFMNVPGYYFARLHQERSYVIALENAQKLDGMYYSIDEKGCSLRNYGNAVLLGGGNHRTGENSKGGKYDELRAQAKGLYPNAKEIAHWSAQDCMPLDNIPYIGHYSNSIKNQYVATGFKKWGMTTSMVAATIISNMISGQETPYEEVFKPSRFNTASVPSLAKEGAKAIKGIATKNLTVSKSVLDKLENGHGGVVEADGSKVGAYKDENGKLFLVSIKCPHMGCQLEWNPDEKSWDCPCHGSRFDYYGKLLDNPAQKGIH